ncbi:hypothetical protein [Domibacillus aminovorans]|uniref:Uncharacterized protein n=1 Tax=Domibacillus aminovorans TaxID=29332 RepID=A0A177LBX0_9BACI|nr:hypothetical protein [Domibacillus aminovorans]OAH62762.1 hypothetical protein AWH49_08840 [Domibacillus aminovorans]
MFRGLLKKDFLLVKTYLWVWLAAIILLYAAGSVFASYKGEFYLVFPFFILLYMGHMVLLPIAACILLKAEEKGQYWLHGTAGGKKLLSSKLISAFLVMIASLILTNLLMAFSLFISRSSGFSIIEQGKFPFIEGLLLKGLMLNGGIVIGALYFTIWGLFLWALYHSLNQYPMLKKIRWIIIAAAYFITNTIIGRMTTWDVVQSFFNQWTIRFSPSASNTIMFEGFGFTLSDGAIQVWPVLLSIIGLLLLFMAAGWLLDRKVEV